MFFFKPYTVFPSEDMMHLLILYTSYAGSAMCQSISYCTSFLSLCIKVSYFLGNDQQSTTTRLLSKLNFTYSEEPTDTLMGLPLKKKTLLKNVYHKSIVAVDMVREQLIATRQRNVWVCSSTSLEHYTQDGLQHLHRPQI